MTPAYKPWAKPIEELNIPKQDISKFDEDKLDKLFYKYKDNTYAPYLKEDIRKEINVYKPCTFLPLMQEFNIPFYPEKWLNIITRQIEKGGINGFDISSVFGRYLMWCKFSDIKNFEFQDSSWFAMDIYDYENYEYIPKINFELKY